MAKKTFVCKTCGRVTNSTRWSTDECFPCRRGAPRCQHGTCGHFVYNVDKEYCWAHRHDEEVVVAASPHWLKELVGWDDKYSTNPADSNKEE